MKYITFKATCFFGYSKKVTSQLQFLLTVCLGDYMQNEDQNAIGFLCFTPFTIFLVPRKSKVHIAHSDKVYIIQNAAI